MASATSVPTMRNDAPCGVGAAPRIPKRRGMSVDPNVVDDRARPLNPSSPPRLGTSKARSCVSSRAPSLDSSAIQSTVHHRHDPSPPHPPRTVTDIRREEQAHADALKEGMGLAITIDSLSLTGGLEAGTPAATAALGVVLRHGDQLGATRLCAVERPTSAGSPLCCFRDAFDFPLPREGTAASHRDYAAREVHLQLVCRADAAAEWAAGALSRDGRGHHVTLPDGTSAIVLAARTLDVRCMAEDAVQNGTTCVETMHLQGPACAFELAIAWRLAPPGSTLRGAVHATPLRFSQRSSDSGWGRLAASIIAGRGIHATDGPVKNPFVVITAGSGSVTSTAVPNRTSADSFEWNERVTIFDTGLQRGDPAARLEVQLFDRRDGATTLVSVGEAPLPIEALAPGANAAAVDVTLTTPAALVQHGSGTTPGRPNLGVLRLLVSADPDPSPGSDWDDVAVSSLTEAALSRVGGQPAPTGGTSTDNATPHVPSSASGAAAASATPPDHGATARSPTAASASSAGAVVAGQGDAASSAGSGRHSPAPREPETHPAAVHPAPTVLKRSQGRKVGGSRKAPLKAKPVAHGEAHVATTSTVAPSEVPSLEPQSKPGVPGVRLHTFERAGARRSASADALRRKPSVPKQDPPPGLEPNLPVRLDTPTWWRSVPMARDEDLPNGDPGYKRLHADALAKEAAALALFDFDLVVQMPEAQPRPAHDDFRLARPWCPPGATEASTHRNFAEVRRALAADSCRVCHGLEPPGSIARCTCPSIPPSRQASPVRAPPGQATPAAKRRFSSTSPRRLSVTSKPIPWYGASSSAANHLAALFRSAAAAARNSAE